MLIGLLGQMGAGKSTVASILAKTKGWHLFDMDLECPEEFRRRNSQGEMVPAVEVKEYQREMVARLMEISKSHHVILAGFFLDNEFPSLIERNVNTLWINLVTEDRQLLERRVSERTDHFATAAARAIFAVNWDLRHEFEFGPIKVDCGQPLEKVVQDCLDNMPN